MRKIYILKQNKQIKYPYYEAEEQGGGESHDV